MKTKLLSILLILLYFFSYAEAKNTDNLTAYIVKDNIDVKTGESGIISIKIEIPENNYIYSNPKGPGIGKPTTVEIKYPNNIIFSQPVFAHGEKYKASEDPDFVWIYRNETSIHLPFKVKRDSGSGTHIIPIVVNALLCSDKSCTPYEFPVYASINVTPALSKKIEENKNNISTFNSNPSDSGTEKKTPKNIPDFNVRFLSGFSVSNILQAVIYGFIAGFILNFMPCVLPVISIKVLDLIKYSGHNRKNSIKMGLTFTLGILTTFMILAFLASFFNYNWGGLFQNSTFLIVMIIIVFIFSLSLFDIFMINVPSFAGKAAGLTVHKYGQAFSKGLLATLLATPCSGPFLGGALAWAFTQTPIVIFVIFMSVGIGMSSPYIILTANPKLLKFIPKPGDWMLTFQKIMGFLLLGTVIYLVGILKYNLVMPVLWLLLFIGVAFWQYGKYGSMIKPIKTRIISILAFILIIIIGAYLSNNFFYKSHEAIRLFESSEKTFSWNILLENKDKGRMSIVAFTADWCPNCKLVEKTALHTDRIAKAISKNNINIMSADLTRKNPEARELLNRLGSRSIPFLAVFPSGKNFYNPVCLRDIYSEKDVLKAIEMVK